MVELTQSYVHGVSMTPLIGETIGVHFDQAAERWTYPRRADRAPAERPLELWRAESQQVDAFAAGLLALGLAPGDRIGIWSPNNAEWVITQFATAKAGLILVNINPAYRLSELEYALNKVGCKALITADRFKTSDYVGMLRELAPEIDAQRARQACRPSGCRRCARSSASATDERPRLFALCRRARHGRRAPPRRARRARRQAAIRRPDQHPVHQRHHRRAQGRDADPPQHPQQRLLHRRGACGSPTSDRVCIPVPLYHCFGMVLGNLACITPRRGDGLSRAKGFDPLATLETVEAERCTALYGVPTMFIAELGHPEFKRFDLSSLRTGIMAGSPCPIEVMKRCVDEMHMREVTIAYGMTETSPVSFQTSCDDPLERRVATVGRVQPHVEVKIVDADGRIVPPGTPGEFCTRGYSVMLGYWGDEERTAEAIDRAGWMHTGDLATIDDDGYCNIVGRIKDMVIRGGENVYPREIEEFLYRHPEDRRRCRWSACPT